MTPATSTPAAPTTAAPGRLADNIVHFGRALRKAGVKIGPEQIAAAIDTVRLVGIRNKQDFYWALHASLVSRRDQHELFDDAFALFWRDPQLLEKMMATMLPTAPAPDEPERKETSRRVSDALLADSDKSRARPEEEMLEFEASASFSAEDVLRQKDFEQMSTEEQARARAAIKRLTLPLDRLPTRRTRPAPHGHRLDIRATLRAQIRSGRQPVALKYRARKWRRPPIVALCDISGSMAGYTRMLLHFLHALTNDRDRVHSFVFGTRLTNITRHLRHKDVDVALDEIAQTVEDWSGGTRIGETLHRFNVDWSRRVLSQGAVVLLITDGLDRDAGEGLTPEIERLHKSCRRLIWLNPLLRYDGFEPRAAGIRVMLAHVDEFRAVHNLESLEDLTAALSRLGNRADHGVRLETMRLETVQ